MALLKCIKFMHVHVHVQSLLEPYAGLLTQNSLDSARSVLKKYSNVMKRKVENPMEIRMQKCS